MREREWLKPMSVIGPQIVQTRQLTRQMNRASAKAAERKKWAQAFEDKFDALADRVQARRAAGKRKVVWPSWWKDAPSGPL